MSLSIAPSVRPSRRQIRGANPGSGFCPKAAHYINNEANQQDQAKPAAADRRPANIKTAATEQEKKNNYEKEYIHDFKIARHGTGAYGALPYSKPTVRQIAATST